MVQAATTGAMDFARMDPRDRWWWRKLRWTLHELHSENQVAGLETQHRHWVTLFANASLDADSFDNTKKQAQEILNKILKLRFPWLGDELAATGAQESLVSQFREAYGYPGDPRYESMLADMMAAFKTLEDGRA
jgi:hypothetical protein